jgi:cyclophilin family peptidyl-prolyl cis-trans isomerase
MADGQESSSGSSGSPGPSRAPGPPGTNRAGCARNGLLGLAAILVVVYLFIQASRSDDNEEAHARSTTTAEPQVTTTVVDPDEGIDPDCPDEDGSSSRQLEFTGPPPLSCLDPDATYVALVETNRGDFEITLDPADAPQAVNSFVFLARYHYYDGVGFHRVIRDFLAQAGDPIDPGIAGGDPGPGYLLPEEPPQEQPFYPEGSVAMANLYPTPEPTGSEFFIVTGRGAETLTPNYSRIGNITSGEEVVAAINATGADDDVLPADLTVIESLTIDQR